MNALLEATLFGAGRSMPQSELAKLFDVSESTMRMSLLDLQAAISEREGGAIQLTEINRFWVLEVKPELANHIPRVARGELPKKLLKTAALIAYHQPMAQNKLVEMMGQVTYEHVSDLRELGLVDKRRDGITRRLTTTRRFSEYFGCPHTAPKEVAAWFKAEAVQLGLTGHQLADALSAPDDGDELPELSEGDEVGGHTLDGDKSGVDSEAAGGLQGGPPEGLLAASEEE